jgi:hypothetical protein
MEQTLTFVLGAASTLGLICLGYAFFSVLRINKIVNQLNHKSTEVENEFGQTHRSIDERFGEVERQMHNRMDDICREIDKKVDGIYQRIDELNRYVDSRFDKQADKAGNVISVVSENSLRNADRLDKLEELFKLQMDQFAKVTLNHSERLAELETDRKVEEDKIEQLNS